MPSKVASSRKDFERLEKVIKDVAKSVNTLQVSNKKLSNTTDELTQKFKKQENQKKKNGQTTRLLTGAFAKLRAQMLIGAFAIGVVNKALFTQISRAVRTAGEFEKLKTRLVSLKGSQEGANKAFAELNRIAATTPFTLQRVVEAGASLEAFGLSAEKNIKLTADLAAFMGVDVVEAASALGRAFAGGAGAADVLRDRGILQLVKSFKGIDDLKSTTLPEFRKALIDTLQAPTVGIVGSTDKLSKTYVGAVSNMQDSVSRLNAAIGSKFMRAAKLFINGIGSMASAAEEFISGDTFEEAVQSKSIDMITKKIIDLQEELVFTKAGALDLGKEMGKPMMAFGVNADALRIKQIQNEINALVDRMNELRGGVVGEDVLTEGLARQRFFEEKNFKVLADGTIEYYGVKLDSEFKYFADSEKLLNDYYTKRHLSQIDALDLEKNTLLAALEDQNHDEETLLALRSDIEADFRQKKIDRDRELLENIKQQKIEFEDVSEATKLAEKGIGMLADEMARLVMEGQSLSKLKLGDVLGQMALSMAFTSLLTPLVAPLAGVGTAALSVLGIAHSGGYINSNGNIQRFANGGVVQGEDNVPILAQSGEFVMSRKAVQSIGLETMNRINEGGGIGGVTVNVSGNVMTQDFVENDLADAIREAARRGVEFN